MRHAALVVSAILGVTLAASAHAGPFAQAFLPNSGGARAFALGGNVACLTEDASGVWLNPARLAFLEGSSVNAGYASLVDGLSSSRLELAYARTFGPSVAAPLQGADAHRLAGGLGIEYQSLELSRGSSYGEGVASLAVAIAPINFASFGLAVRGGRSFTDVEGLTANGVTLDAGAAISVWPNIEVALVARNLGGSVTYEDRAAEQPLGTLTFAAAFMRHSWIAVEAGVTSESEDGLVYHGGVEVRPIALVALRGGLSSRVRPQETTIPTAGLGIRTGSLAFDYGAQFGPEEDLGVRHRVTLGYRIR